MFLAIHFSLSLSVGGEFLTIIIKITMQNLTLYQCASNSLLAPKDVNDNVPFFTSSIYEASVTEGAEIGTLVLQVSAHDKDLGLNGEVCADLQCIQKVLRRPSLFRLCYVVGTLP